jgi:hypothetical protein
VERGKVRIRPERGVALRLSFLTLLALALAGSGWAAQGKKIAAGKTASAVSVLQRTSTLKVSVVPLGGSGPMSGSSQSTLLDLGNVSYGGGGLAPGVTLRRTKGGVLLTSRFGLLLQDGGDSTVRTATVSAFVLNANSGKTYTVDGVKLTTGPQVVSTMARVGTVSAHRLEIQVPIGENPGQVSDAVGFLVTTN